jgi:hypothetical protein
MICQYRLANCEIKIVTNKNQKPRLATEKNAELKKWEASPDGIMFKKWEESPAGKKVHAGAAKINKYIVQRLIFVKLSMYNFLLKKTFVFANINTIAQQRVVFNSNIFNI